jgi:hypothetical protein
MDRTTLLAHRPLWTTEEAPHIATLDRLTPEEAKLYADLRFDRFGRCVRLEQERISFVCCAPSSMPLVGRSFTPRCGVLRHRANRPLWPAHLKA